MADNEVIIDVVARLDKAEAAIKRFEGQAESAGKNAGTGFGTNFGKAAAVAAAAALAGMVVVLKQGIDAAIEQEDAINQLNGALARTGQFSAEASIGLQKFASDMQKNTTFSDDAILTNAALIQSLGKLSVEGLKQATTAAADLATTLQIDLRTASLMVGKAAAGEIGTFGRYGIVIKEGANAAETFANTLKALAPQQGAAAAKANTFSGTMEKLKNAFGELLESVGNIIIKSPGLVNVFKLLSGALLSLAGTVDKVSASGFLDKLLIKMTEFAQAANNTVIKTFEAIVNAIRNVGGVVTAVANAINGTLNALTGVGSFSGVIDQLKKDYEGLNKVAADTRFSDGITAGLEAVRVAVETAPPLQMPPVNGPDIKPVVTEVTEQMKQMQSAIHNVVHQIISTSLTSLGAALIQGGKAFGSFAKTAAGFLGDFFIQMGMTIIMADAAIIALKASLFSFFGGGGIAAGIGLVIAGGALKALAGGPSSTSGAPESATTSAAAAPVGTSTSNLQETEATAPGTAVTVNVQGNILDRRETGLEIAQIINESFSSGGIVMARGAFV